MEWISDQNVPRRSTTRVVLHSHRLLGSSYYRTEQENSGNACVRRVGDSGLIHEDMNAEMGVLLRSRPPGDSMDMGKWYDDDDWLR